MLYLPLLSIELNQSVLNVRKLPYFIRLTSEGLDFPGLSLYQQKSITPAWSPLLEKHLQFKKVEQLFLEGTQLQIHSS